MLQQNAIKFWAEDDRPREKLLLKGKHNLSDAELLAIILQSGNREKSAVELARELLQASQNSLSLFASKTIHDLCKHKGIGEAKAISIIAALELGNRKISAAAFERKKFTSSTQVYQHLLPFYDGLIHEEFYVIYLNNGNFLLKTERVSMGGMTATTVDRRLILKRALELNATGIILSHNHPSGNLIPSEQDKRLTHIFLEAAKLMDILLIDHLIVTQNGFYSFSDDGKMR